MSGASKSDPVITIGMRYSLLGPGGIETAAGEGQLRLDSENLSILPKQGEAMLFPLRDTEMLSAADYQARLSISSGEKLTLAHLGRQFDDFVRTFARCRNQLILQDMLVYEAVRQSGLKGHCQFPDKGEDPGECELCLYQTALVVIPPSGKILRLPYSYMKSVEEGDYTLKIKSENAPTLILSRMGRQFDTIKRELNLAINELALQSQKMVGELLPEADPATVRNIARLMKDGRAVRQQELDAIAPNIWPQLEDQLSAVGIEEEYLYLKALSHPGQMAIGIKRGLSGEADGLYTWFLIPIYTSDPKQPGNAIALEATSGDGSGRATYFFRIIGRKEYGKISSLDQMHQKVRDFIGILNYSMLAINFRREPIYLTPEQIREPHYARYRYSLQVIPELKLLRQHFIGRIFHRDQEQWEGDVDDLLRFNITSREDEDKWNKEKPLKGGEGNSRV